ncbi:Abortive infection C-terminus [Methylophilus rhizosphaerae]|uniref:Abortive infection C-terminus n=1 Tax=Methylophilus rhizosphaerae TaxID=492660 RepID=A0A1G9A7T9_9PROT|nr:abortive infection family protein [Methylophilus rhizosphaerae]SDK22520.1 Abortive infection C-terminus [Methylophilus rhizosphaerae]
MKLSDYSIEKIGVFIAGDSPGWPYRRGVDLVDFFNKFGSRDVYGEGFPTRRVYAQTKLADLNNKPQLRNIFKELLDPRLWIDLDRNTNGEYSVEVASNALNELIKYDGYEAYRDGNFYKIRELSGTVIEVENRFGESSELNEVVIEEQIQKCREKIDLADYSGAITNARSLVEAVCLKIIKEVEGEIENEGDLIKIFNQARKLLNLDPKRQDINDSLKQVITGLSNIVNGLAAMRNKMSDAHGVSYKPSRHHAKLAVNSAKTLADFLFDTMSYQKEKGTIKK